jgi:hypothetical protein
MADTKADADQDDMAGSSDDAHHRYVFHIICHQPELTVCRRHRARRLLCASSTIPILPSLLSRWRDCLSRLRISASERDRPHLGGGTTGSARSNRRDTLYANTDQVVLGCE